MPGKVVKFAIVYCSVAGTMVIIIRVKAFVT